jgi:hypothetical protein
VPLPVITAITVRSGMASESRASTATITGKGLGELGLSWFNVGPYRSYFSANYSFVAVSSTRLVVTLPIEGPTTQPLSQPVTVQTLGSPNTGDIAGAAPSNSKTVTYEPTPTLTSMSVLAGPGQPAQYPAGPTTGGTEIELAGTGFGPDPVTQAAAGFADVAFTDVGAPGKSGGYANATVYHLLSGSETAITFNTVGDNPGIDQVSWCNISGCTARLSKGDIFTYYPIGNPIVSSVSPDTGKSGTEVTVTGANLGFVEAVYFGKIKAAAFANVPAILDSGSTTQVKATAPPGAVGSKVDVRVVTLESEATGFGKSRVNPKAIFDYTS